MKRHSLNSFNTLTKIHLLVFLLLFLSCRKGFAQGTYTFKVNYPDSAKIYINDQFIGFAPKTFDLKLDFKSYYQYDLKILKSGFPDKIISYTTFPSENPVVINGALIFKKIKPGNYVDNAQMINSALKSEVTINAVHKIGSGFMITEDGYLITNYHVVSNEDNIHVSFENGLTFPVEVVYFDKDFDVALLKLKGCVVTPFAIGNSDSIKIGEDVIAIGTPTGTDLAQTVSKGIISARRMFDGCTYLQSDASINPGNSGGPLINTKGEVIGIVSRKRSNAEGIAFAIPINLALEKLNISFK